MDLSPNQHPQYYDLDSSNDSITSSIFGFYCEICNERANGASDLEMQYLSDSTYLIDNTCVIWVKCDNCGACYHKNCWERTSNWVIDWRFECCE